MLSHEPLETDAAWQWPGGDDGFFRRSRVQFGPLSLSRRLLDAATSEPGGRDWKLNVHFERRTSHVI